MNCEYLIDGKCSLGYYGGRPYPHNCAVCLRGGMNNPESAEKLFASREKTHPQEAKRVSGCCDSANNYYKPDNDGQ